MAGSTSLNSSHLISFGACASKGSFYCSARMRYLKTVSDKLINKICFPQGKLPILSRMFIAQLHLLGDAHVNLGIHLTGL